MPRSPYLTLFKIGVDVGLNIFDRLQPDPLDAINSQLTQLLQNSIALLDGIDTVQSTLVITTLSERESTIKQALFNLRDAQTNGNAAAAAHAAQNALDMSLDALTDLTTLANNTSGAQIERSAIIPLLYSAMTTRLAIVRELEDGAFATHHGTPLNDAVTAIRAAEADIYREAEADVIIYVDSATLHFLQNEATVTMHFISALVPTAISASFTMNMTIADWYDYFDQGIGGPGARDTTTILNWGDATGNNFRAWIAPFVNHDLSFAGFTNMQTFLGEVDHLTSGQWLRGDAGSNVLTSDQSALYTSPDTLEGFGDEDTLQGGGGDDLLRGGGGDDVLEGGLGDDVINGGSGKDRAIFSGPLSTVVFLNQSGPQSTGHGMDTLISIEHVTSGSGRDYLFGNDLANHLISGAGEDELLGGRGQDTLEGGADNDELKGERGNDILNGGAGDDWLYGGTGIDRAIFEGAAITVNLSKSGFQNTGQGNDFLDGIENVTSGSGQDKLTGNGLANSLVSGGGSDTLSGLGGNDSLEGGNGHDKLNGGSGNDRLNGGNGIDTAQFFGTADVTVNLGISGAQNTGHGNDTLLSIENILSGSGNDKLTGNGSDNALSSGAGDDTLTGAGGSDVLSSGRGKDKLFGGEDADTLNGGRGADKLFGNNGNDKLYGNNDNDTLFGNSGHDTLSGGKGADRLEGGSGNDKLVGGQGSDDFIFKSGDGNDTITDFDALNGQEDIDLSAVLAIANFADLSANHMNQTGANVTINDGNGLRITLLGVDLGDLGSGDFIF